MPKNLSIALAFCIATGCHMFPKQELAGSHSPLKPAQRSPDSIAIEIIWARFPANDPVLDDAAWREIDETQIDPSVRRELVNNGLRAGIISGALPPAIDRVLRQGAKSDSSDEGSEHPSASPKSQSVALLSEPIVHGRIRRLRRKQRFEIQASETYPSLPLLVSGDNELNGRPYEQAEAVY